MFISAASSGQKIGWCCLLLLLNLPTLRFLLNQNFLLPSSLTMYLENKSNLEIEMSQTSPQDHQGRSSLRSPEAVAGNFGELRLLQGISERRDTQKLQQSAVLPSGQCIKHSEGFVPVRQEDGYDYWKCYYFLLLLTSQNNKWAHLFILSDLTTLFVALSSMPIGSNWKQKCWKKRFWMYFFVVKKSKKEKAKSFHSTSAHCSL